MYNAYYKIYSGSFPSINQFFYFNLAFTPLGEQIVLSYKGCYFKISKPKMKSFKRGFTLRLAANEKYVVRQKNYQIHISEDENTSEMGKLTPRRF